MKSVLISIRPQWCKLIAAGKKTIEVRKTKPKLSTPFKVYIYCTAGVGKNTLCLPVSHKRIMEHYAETGSMDSLNAPIGNGKIVGEFVCDRVYQYASDMFRSAPLEGVDISTEEMVRSSCLTAEELYRYEHSAEPKENCINLIGVYGWHISELKIYDKPKELRNFCTIDKQAVKRCEYRKRAYNNPHLTNGAFLPGSYVCMQGEIDWCLACKRKAMIRPPQSWCYVEGLL